MRIYLLTAFYFLLQIASFLLPRHVINPSEGFVSAAEAVLLFAAIQFIAGASAVGEFLYIYRTRHKLTRAQVITGILPLVITILGSLVFFAIFRYR